MHLNDLKRHFELCQSVLIIEQRSSKEEHGLELSFFTLILRSIPQGWTDRSLFENMNP